VTLTKGYGQLSRVVAEAETYNVFRWRPEGDYEMYTIKTDGPESA